MSAKNCKDCKSFDPDFWKGNSYCTLLKYYNPETWHSGKCLMDVAAEQWERDYQKYQQNKKNNYVEN